jgi:hypothetical protein
MRAKRLAGRRCSTGRAQKRALRKVQVEKVPIPHRVPPISRELGTGKVSGRARLRMRLFEAAERARLKER